MDHAKTVKQVLLFIIVAVTGFISVQILSSVLLTILENTTSQVGDTVFTILFNSQYIMLQPFLVIFTIIFELFRGSLNILSNIPFFTLILYLVPGILSLLICLYFTRYIIKTKKWILGLSLCYLSLFSMSCIMISFFLVYNSSVGLSCNIDSDCTRSCENGIMSRYYININSPSISETCSSSGLPKCINSKCIIAGPEYITNISECREFDWVSQRLRYRAEDIDMELADYCIYLNAKRIGNSTICDLIRENESKIYCQEKIE